MLRLLVQRQTRVKVHLLHFVKFVYWRTYICDQRNTFIYIYKETHLYIYIYILGKQIVHQTFQTRRLYFTTVEHDTGQSGYNGSVRLVMSFSLEIYRCCWYSYYWLIRAEHYIIWMLLSYNYSQ